MAALPPFVTTQKWLKELCTFGIGGPAKYFTTVQSIDDLRHALEWASQHKIPTFILGKGSNCLFDDRGFDGLVIHNKIAFLETPQPGHFYAGAGYSYSLLGSQTARQGYTGLEFASGIPCSVGGAVFMNAGANGRETCDSLVEVEYIHPDGHLETYPRGTLTFAYRSSPFQQMQGVIVAALFQLEKGDDARKKQIEIITKRKSSQPLQEMSAGCIFRNPEQAPAGKLIDEWGLKGLAVGDACVSNIHGNFIVNKGSASAEDVKQLIQLIKHKIKEQTGVALESEVRFIPYQPETTHD